MSSFITSVEMNYLVFRYLQESGFTHSAFTLGYEAGINKSPIEGGMVPPGALVTFVQRGLRYLEMEANVTNEETDVDEDFLFLQPLDIITKNIDELKQIIKEKKKKLQKEDMKEDMAKGGDESQEKEKGEKIEQGCESERSRVRERTRHEREKGLEKSRGRKGKDKDPLKLEDQNKETTDDQEAKTTSKLERNGTTRSKSYFLR